MGIHIDHELVPLSAKVPNTTDSRGNNGNPQPCMMLYAERNDVGPAIPRCIPDSNLTPTPQGPFSSAIVLRYSRDAIALRIRPPMRL